MSLLKEKPQCRQGTAIEVDFNGYMKINEAFYKRTHGEKEMTQSFRERLWRNWKHNYLNEGKMVLIPESMPMNTKEIEELLKKMDVDFACIRAEWIDT